MSKVVNVTEVGKAFISLGWNTLSLSEVGEWLTASGIDPAEFLLYCKALLDNPDGMDPTSIAGVKPADAPYIYGFLHSKGVVY